jgi:hypothetical protein
MPGDYRHDIALLHIDRPFVFESNLSLTKTCIHRIDSSISTNQYPKNGTLLAIIGWGTLQFGTAYLPEILQQAQVFTIDNQDPICLNSINNTELQFCAGLFEGGKGKCLIHFFQSILISFFSDSCQGMFECVFYFSIRVR